MGLERWFNKNKSLRTDLRVGDRVAITYPIVYCGFLGTIKEIDYRKSNNIYYIYYIEFDNKYKGLDGEYFYSSEFIRLNNVN